KAAAAVHRDAAFAVTLPGQVYAQPLWVADGPGHHEAFLVATESNHVTAIGANGSVVWDRAYGDAARAGLPCGNIAVGGATLGVTGVPVIDAASRTIYFDAMTRADSSSPRHLIHAVSIDDGVERPGGWPIDVSSAVPGFDSPHQNQRGALLLLDGILYVPYGGHFGDCLPYYGWVGGVNVARPSSVQAWRAAGPPTWNTRPPVGAAGIWATGGLASDGSYVYAATGNSMNGGFAATPSWVGGDGVFKLAAGPKFSNRTTDYYYPSNWRTLDERDTDLGGANPVLVDMPRAPYPHLVVVLGKDGKIYLLNRDDLGGQDGALFVGTVADGAVNSSAAAYTTPRGTYVAFRTSGRAHGCANGGNLGVAKISPDKPPTASVVWCSKSSSLGSPIVTTPDGKTSFVVWDASTRLYGYDGDTGTLVFDGDKDPGDAMPDGLHYFNAPIDASGRIVVATCGACKGGPGNGRLLVFR
ncbi:MAG TPA: hypothetical protein VLM85_32775, partial [Polyangiaceae bacterium]|nr:hypothetical protein [Polyangiaceae bacterium]